MIHSSQKTFDEIRSFMVTYNKLDKRVPVVAVPSTYNYVTEDDLFASGISMCISRQPHAARGVPRMQQVAEGILRAGTSAYIQNMMSSVKTIINLLPNTGQTQDLPLRRVPGGAAASLPPTKVDAGELAHLLKDRGVKRFFGVPDSVLKPFCTAVENLSSASDMTHVISCNEGAALTTAAGWHLATNDVPVVYFQNTGFGNMINPLMSLCHGDAFGVPVVLLIGWRGEPSVSDEPQHRAQGRQMIPMLESCEIESLEMPTDTLGAANTIEKAADTARAKKCPVAVLVRRGIPADRPPPGKASVSHRDETPQNGALTRREALEEVLDLVGNSDDFMVSTTGYTSRELYADLLEERRKDSQRPAGGERLHGRQHGARVIDRTRRRFGTTAATCVVHRRRWRLAHAHGKSGLHCGSRCAQPRARGVEQLLPRICRWTTHRGFTGAQCTQRTLFSRAPRARGGLHSCLERNEWR